MKVLRRDWFDVARGDTWRLYPLGDIHLGAAACDERLLKAAIERIKADERAYWVGLGDYCDFINVSDPRFSSESLADWVKVSHLGDLAGAQTKRLLELFEPIAGKCLGLIEGNHERAVFKHYERSIYSDIVTGIKLMGDFPAEHQLALGYCGWLIFGFYRAPTRHRGTVLKANLHHGFVGGRLAGAKALNMQRWLWNHEADLVIFGHSHNTGVQVEAVEKVRGSRVTYDHRIGCYAGTFLGMNGRGKTTYSQEKGYFPLPVTQPHIILRPGSKYHRERIQVVV